MTVAKGGNGIKRRQYVLAGVIMLLFIVVDLVWSLLFDRLPDPDYWDFGVELLFAFVTLIVYSMVWGLGIRALQIGGGLFLLGIYMDALDDFYLAPEYVDVFICQGLQLVGLAIFAWSTYYYYLRLSQRVTWLRRDLAEMEFRATHDALTSLPNRLLFHDRLSQALAGAERRQRQVAVLYIDLDNMKQVNDTYGHTIGDDLLQEIGQRLQSSVRETDTVARLGGDEFAIIQTDINRPEDARNMAAKLLQAINQIYHYNGKPITASASVGISIYPIHAHKAENLLMLADSAMYKAKHTDADERIVVYDNHAA